MSSTHTGRIDTTAAYPQDLFDLFVDAGLTGLCVPEHLGGSGAGIFGLTLAIEEVAKHVDFVFCAVDMPKDDTRKLEEDYAKREIPVVSNNSAHRGTPDVPMMVPEINSGHVAIIEAQRRRRGFYRFIGAPARANASKPRSA